MTRSKRKLLISLLLLMFVLLSVISVIALVFALQQQTITTNLNIGYAVNDLDGSVCATYSLGGDDPEWLIPYASGGKVSADGHSLVFEAENTTAAGTLEFPNDITLTSQKDYIIIKYTYSNTGSRHYIATMSLDSELVYENMKVEYSIDGSEYTENRYALVLPGATASSPSTRSYWIKISIVSKTKNASFTGDFRWDLVGCNEASEGYKSLSDLTFVETDTGTYKVSVSTDKDTIGTVTYPSSINGNTVTAIAQDSSLTTTQKESVTAVEIPTTVTEIGDSAFEGYSYLQIVRFKQNDTLSQSATAQSTGLKTIGNKVFKDCSSLTSLNIPSTVKTIGNYAFSGCSALADLTIPTGLTSFGSYAYYNCTSLTTIFIPQCVASYSLKGLQHITGIEFEGGPCQIDLYYNADYIPEVGYGDTIGVVTVDIANNSPEENYATINHFNYTFDKGYEIYYYIELYSITYKLSTSVEILCPDGYAISSGNIIGDSIQLSANVMPEITLDKSVTWKLTSGTAIASISSSGLLTFNGYGSATVRVTTNDTGLTADAVITHVDEINNILVYNSSDSLITSSATGSTPRIDVGAGEDRNMDIRVELDTSGILDAYTVSLDDVTVTAEANYSYESMSVIRNTLNKNLFTIQERYTNEAHGGTVTVAYKNSIATFWVYYNYLEGLMANSTRYGLEGKRVYAARSYSGGSVVQTIDLTDVVIRAPETNMDPIYCSIETGSSYVSLNSNIIVPTTYGSSLHNNISLQLKSTPSTDETITIKIYCEDMVSYYSFVLLGSSFNVLNVYDQEGLNYCLTNGYPFALQRSLGTSEDGEDYSPLTKIDTMESSTKIRFSHMIYGNGFTLNFNALKTSDTFNIMFHNTRNLVIKGENASSSKDYTNVIGFVGTHVYCEVLQCNKVWTFASSSTTSIIIKNSIFKDTKHCGLQIGDESEGSVYLENTIFDDVGQAAVEFQGGRLYIKGVFDVYNFRSASEFDSSSWGVNVGSAIEDAYASTDFANYVTTNSNGDKVANIAIMMPPDTLKPNTTKVYFYNGSSYALLSSSTDTTTGIGYKQISYSKTILNATIYEICLVLPPNTATIQPGDKLTEAGESKIYG